MFLAILPGHASGMQIDSMSDILFSSNTVVVDLNVVSQKQLFQDIAARLISAHDLSINSRDIVAAAVERERLGSTGVGNGCLLYTSPSPRDGLLSRMPSSA